MLFQDTRKMSKDDALEIVERKVDDFTKKKRTNILSVCFFRTVNINKPGKAPAVKKKARRFLGTTVGVPQQATGQWFQEFHSRQSTDI